MPALTIDLPMLLGVVALMHVGSTLRPFFDDLANKLLYGKPFTEDGGDYTRLVVTLLGPLLSFAMPKDSLGETIIWGIIYASIANGTFKVLFRRGVEQVTGGPPDLPSDPSVNDQLASFAVLDQKGESPAKPETEK